MHYGELIIKGKSNKEILLSTYICHPSMANNEISGIVVTTALAKELSSLNNYYTYRILFIPETIGSIAYLSRNSKTMINKTLAGLVITCVGDNNNYSFMPTRLGNTYSDLVAKYVLNMYTQSHVEYTFLQRGSDERQYCSPKINLPIVSIMRSKYGTYPEYHTSLDNLNFISKEGLFGAYEIIFKFLNVIEHDRIYEPLYTCEPQLGKRGLYNISSNQDSDDLINLIAYFDGKTSLLEICKLISCDFFMSLKIIDKLLENHLIQRIK
jgi:aminopeptidase-like protein